MLARNLRSRTFTGRLLDVVLESFFRHSPRRLTHCPPHPHRHPSGTNGTWGRGRHQWHLSLPSNAFARETSSHPTARLAHELAYMNHPVPSLAPHPSPAPPLFEAHVHLRYIIPLTDLWTAYLTLLPGPLPYHACFGWHPGSLSMWDSRSPASSPAFSSWKDRADARDSESSTLEQALWSRHKPTPPKTRPRRWPTVWVGVVSQRLVPPQLRLSGCRSRWAGARPS